MKKKKFSLTSLLYKIEPKKRLVCNAILKDLSQEFNLYPGSMTKHQQWKGGYRDHVEEVMNIACALYEALDARRRLAFSLSDALFILFIHDLDKILRYKRVQNAYVQIRKFSQEAHREVVRMLTKEYGHTFTKQELNALAYIHGEGVDYHPTKRVMQPLAAFVHCCDMISARIWHDKGRDEQWW